MKKNQKILPFIYGLIVSFIICNTVPTLANGILQQIYVSFDPVKIIIDGQEKNPPEDMKPLIYNGRTYVPLRYIGEAFAKEVTWTEATRTINIGTPKPRLTSLQDTFINTPMNEKWFNNNGVFTFDGPNGMICERGILALNDFFPDSACNYTVEFEACIIGDQLFQVRLSRNNQELVDNLYISNYHETISFNSSGIASFVTNKGEYYKVKIQVENKQFNLYINGKYIASGKLTGDKAGFGFVGDYRKYFVRNFKIQID